MDAMLHAAWEYLVWLVTTERGLQRLATIVTIISGIIATAYVIYKWVRKWRKDSAVQKHTETGSTHIRSPFSLVAISVVAILLLLGWLVWWSLPGLWPGGREPAVSGA